MLWCLLEITQATNDSTQQVRRLMRQRTTDTVVLHIIPDELIRAEFWRIRWQKEQTELSLQRLNVRFDLLGAMRRMPIYDQVDGAALSVNQTLQEGDEHLCADSTAHHHEAQLTACTDR